LQLLRSRPAARAGAITQDNLAEEREMRIMRRL
jgi:hypothetical protein